MLIIALVLAVIALAALVFAVVSSNVVVAWFCIGFSVLGVVLLVFDALRERQRRATGTGAKDADSTQDSHADAEPAEYPAEASDQADESSAPEESLSATDAADSVSDDHNAR
jgi:hypothetical protein